MRAFLAQNGFPGVGGGRYFTNAIDTETNGVDVIVGYETALGSANLRLTAGYNANRTRVTRISETPPALSEFRSVLFDRIEQARIEKGQPGSNLNLMGVLGAGRTTLTLRTQRFGEVTAFGTAAELDQTFGGKWISDAAVGVRLFGQVGVIVGVDNVFDVNPARNSLGDGTTAGNSNFGVFPYNSVSPFGFNGRFLYSRATLVF